MPFLCCTNARLVMPDGAVHGSLTAEIGSIRDVDTPRSIPGALDFKGDYLLPGLVEIHTDNIEKHFLPRSGVRWPTSLTANPAQALELTDRGELLPGKRADLLRVRMVDDVPVVVAVWREGRQVI